MNNYLKTHILYGGDYNPDQWPEKDLDTDIQHLKKLNVNTVTLPVFSWAYLQPSENKYNFGWLDNVLKKLNDTDIKIIMATPTAVPPAWMCKAHSDILSVDKYGRERKFGGRINFCPNSPSFRKYSRNIAEKMAEHYKKNRYILLWHINNEYNNNFGNLCYCENCRKAFIKWLKNKYKSLDELNKRWDTNFWGHTFYDWDEIEAPSYLTEVFPDARLNHDRTNFQIIAVDYFRFNSDCIISCYKNEVDGIKKYIPDAICTTNIVWQGIPLLDLYKLGKQVDIVSWDNYPSYNESPHKMAFNHDFMRSLKNDKSFLLMEQTPSQTNWHDYNTLKRPGVMRLLSYQALAHGSDSVLFFQIKQSKSACEKYHAALIPHAGHLDTRMGNELIKLGTELKKIGDSINEKKIKSKVGIIIDWESWWNIEYSIGPSIAIKYLDQLYNWYAPFFNKNIPVDILSLDKDFNNYKIIIAPLLNMISLEHAEKIKKFTENGGIFITTYFSGIVNKDDQVYLGGYPGAFRDLLGLWVEEVDALSPEINNQIILNKDLKLREKQYKCNLIFEIIHTTHAKSLATYGKEYYKNSTCITRNKYGKGEAWYIGTQPESIFLNDFIGYLKEEFFLKSNFSNKSNAEKMKKILSILL